jgi:hypothetical protein
MLGGAATNARQAYDEFFKLWKEADADLPVLIDAKKEYERNEMTFWERMRPACERRQDPLIPAGREHHAGRRDACAPKRNR